MRTRSSSRAPYCHTSTRISDLIQLTRGFRFPGLFALLSWLVWLAASAISLADDISCCAVAPLHLLGQSVGEQAQSMLKSTIR